MNFDFPPTMGGVCSHKSQVTVNDSFTRVGGVKSQPQTIGSIGRPDWGLETIYFNGRSIVPNLTNCMETWLDSVITNSLSPIIVL